MNIFFHKPFFDENEVNAVSRVMRSGFIGSGPFVKRFEHLFCTYIGSSHAVAVNSCTSALHLSLEAAGIGKGDEVITTSVTFCSTILAILYTGAVPVLVDVDRRDLCMDVMQIEKKITSKTKAVLAVHYAGIACALDKIRDICSQYKLVLIEDAAHAVSTKYHGVRIGNNRANRNEMTCFSFQATKNLSIGDGGMITTENEEIAQRLKELRLFGLKETEYKNPYLDAAFRFRQESIGFKYNMTDIEAAIGIVQLQKLALMDRMRREAVQQYAQQISSIPYIEPLRGQDDPDCTWYIYIVKIREEFDKQGLRDKLIGFLAERGVQTSIHFQPVYQIPALQKYFKIDKRDFTTAETYSKRVLSLPLYPSLKKEEIQYITDCINAFFEVNR